MATVMTVEQNYKEKLTPVRCKKRLASVNELKSERWCNFMQMQNSFAQKIGMVQYDSTSRLWEYPWIWFNLEKYKGQNMSLLDIGTQRSPYPWLLAGNGFDVTVSDVTGIWKKDWLRASRLANVEVKQKILNAQYMKLQPASFDIVLSVSVLEHMTNKKRAITEAARTLKPGGMLIITFDVCEPEMGMKYPRKFERALTLKQFDSIISGCPYFDNEYVDVSWNTDDIADYLRWHIGTSHYHNYATAACIVRRNERLWNEEGVKKLYRNIEVPLGILFNNIWFKSIETTRKIYRRIKKYVRH